MTTRLQFTYTPGSNDPTPSNNKLHWIERVVSNHLSDDLPNGGHGVPEDMIEIYTAAQSDNPYYDTFFDAGRGTYFQQTSTKNDPQNSHNWFGEVYLVEETAPQTVTIYNGLLWGWTNIVSNSSGGGSGGGGFQSAAAARNINRELPISDIDSGDTSQLTQSTPESKSTFASAIGSWFKSLGSQNKNTKECSAQW